MKARFDVESAKLDASKSEIVSRIEGAEAQLKVTDAEQSLRQAEEKLKADRAKTAATVKRKVTAMPAAKQNSMRSARITGWIP